jgi:hypothetical protein
VGRKYINSCKFISPYGTSLADSTIGFLYILDPRAELIYFLKIRQKIRLLVRKLK